MTKTSPYVITISRQLGSGGAYLGKRLAFRLNALYLDHQIVCQAAQELGIPEQEAEIRDEKVTSRWQLILKTISGTSERLYAPSPQTIRDKPEWLYTPPPLDAFTDNELSNAESDFILRIANQQTAVIVGRGGYYVLRQHPRCLSIFLYANINFRQQRVQELYHVLPQQALKLISSIDRERGGYLRKLTGQNWFDARQFHLSLDTSAVGLDKAEAIILETLQGRFNDIESRR